MIGRASTAAGALLAAACTVPHAPVAPELDASSRRPARQCAQEPGATPPAAAPTARAGTPPPIEQDPAAAPAAPREGAAGDAWTWSLEGYAYAVANGGDFVSTIARFDRGLLHLEARYNYEDLETASLWAGVNFAWGDELTLELTPMFGVVFGQTDGVAPGYELTLRYRIFELYSEAEYVIDTGDDSGSDSGDYFYTWSELTAAPTDWLRAGIVAQRTRTFESDSDVQGGILLGVSSKRLDATAYVFNLGWDDPTFVFSVGLGF